MDVWCTARSSQAAWLWVGSEVLTFPYNVTVCQTQHWCPLAGPLSRQGRLPAPPLFLQLCQVFAERSPLTTSHCDHPGGEWLPGNSLSSSAHETCAGTLAIWACWSLQSPTGSSFNLFFSFWNLKDAEMFELQIVTTSSISNYAAFLVCTFEATGKAWLSGVRRAVPPAIPWVFGWSPGA